MQGRLAYLQETNPKLRERVGLIEQTRGEYDAELAEARLEGRPEPDSEGVDLRSADEIQEELAEQKAAMDMIINTNPGVIAEYEKRKRDVSFLFDVV